MRSANSNPSDAMSEQHEGGNQVRPPPLVIKILGKSTSKVVAGTFFVALAIRRDAFMLSFFIGAICNGIISKLAKKLLDQQRPPDLDRAKTKTTFSGIPSDGGMPSSHAMSLGFIGTFTILNLASLPWINPALLSAVIVSYAVVSLVYRVQVRLHTTEQVLAGSMWGSINGYIYHSYVRAIVQQHLLQRYPYIFDQVTGKFPVPLLIAPALVGLVVVGSLERRVLRWWKEYRSLKRA
jgi:membrane-associated phospholipid phosphatase